MAWTGVAGGAVAGAGGAGLGGNFADLIGWFCVAFTLVPFMMRNLKNGALGGLKKVGRRSRG